MRFERVTAWAFGPLTEEALELVPGMNVIWGPNEAGKSTWHAALYAGLCGMRRARGKPTSEDQRFAERHRPWDGSSWDVGTTIHLADGRSIELRHDLAGRVNARATDANLGRDCSDEIINDGAPDGSRWLGLDRRSFAATACIRQADLLSVLDDPALLQEQLQRAADTGGTDATAAAALARLERFRAEQVGRNIASAVRPLRRAHASLEEARQRLGKAREEHYRYLDLAAEIEALEAEVAALNQRIHNVRARQSHGEAQALRDRYEAALELARTFPRGAPTIDPTTHELARELTEGLEAWRHQPADLPLTGSTAAELQAQLADLDRQVNEHRAAARGRLSRVPLALGLALLVVAVIVGILGQTVLAVVAGGLALGLLAWLVTQQRTGEIAEGDPAGVHAAHRRALERELNRRIQDETLARDRASQRQARADALWALAARCGIGISPDMDLLPALESWLAQQQEYIRTFNDSARRYAELARRQGPSSLSELEAKLRAISESELIAANTAADSAGLTLPELEALGQEASQALARLQGQRLELQQALPSVAEEEERCLAAEAELARVERLDAILAATQRFLGAAQDRVHRSIAPVLASSIRDRLTRITGGRYRDARVDPASLVVQVQTAWGDWRDATLLSHGTAEQVYLLLRVALAEHLTRPGEVCPLILDDITAHCDDERTVAVLETLHQISQERQVILFSQESQVRQWAETTLTGPQDRVITLQPVASGALA